MHGTRALEFLVRKIVSATKLRMGRVAVTTCAAGEDTTHTTLQRCRNASVNFTGAVRSNVRSALKMLSSTPASK